MRGEFAVGSWQGERGEMLKMGNAERLASGKFLARERIRRRAAGMARFLRARNRVVGRFWGAGGMMTLLDDKNAAGGICSGFAMALRNGVASRNDEENEKLAVLAKNADRHKGFLLPTELRTRELDMLPVWLRERAFFMAAVERVETLQEFEVRVQRMARGELSVQEARAELRDVLDRAGYAPEAGQEGTMKDLRSMRRMNVTLETNLAQIHGYSRWQRQQEALTAFPAQQFVRLRHAKVPRMDWPERFAAAVAATTPEGANVQRMAALVNHPCWVELSRFGTPYAPFDFGSGMGLEPLDAREAAAMGIETGAKAGPEVAEMMEEQDRGLNESLEATPAIHEQTLRDALAEVLQGFAEWDGKRLVFTDPNGTRPYGAEKLAEVWSRPLPEAFAGLPGNGQMQRQAFVEWVSDSREFKDMGDRNKWADLLRVHRRIEPSANVPEVLYRGMKLEPEVADEVLRTWEKVGYSPRPAYPAESWTNSPAAAARFAATTGRKWSVIVEAVGADGRDFKDISQLVRRFSAQIGKKSVPPVVTESEWLLAGTRRYKVLDVRRDNETRTVHVRVQSGRGMR